MVILLPRKIGGELAQKRKSESAKTDTEDCENTYVIVHLKMGEANHDLDDSKWLLAQRRIGQMENNINNYKSITHEFNVLSNILNPMKRAKSKNNHYSPILQGCMNTRSGRGENRNFWILLDSGSSSTILMGKLTSKLK